VGAVHCGITRHALLKSGENMAVYGSGRIAIEAGLSGQCCTIFSPKIRISHCWRCILTTVDADEYDVVWRIVEDFTGDLVALRAIATIDAVIDFKYGIFVLGQSADGRCLGG